jgi:quercetin dioxygenase-like cupin family protein
MPFPLRLVRYCRAVPPEGVIALGPEGGEHLPRGPRHHRVLAERAELELIELRFGPEFDGVPLHEHADHADTFYVLAGEVDFLLEDEVVRAGPGSFFAAPPGLRHGFRMVEGSELRLLNIHAPNVSFVERVREE